MKGLGYWLTFERIVAVHEAALLRIAMGCPAKFRYNTTCPASPVIAAKVLCSPAFTILQLTLVVDKNFSARIIAQTCTPLYLHDHVHAAARPQVHVAHSPCKGDRQRRLLQQKQECTLQLGERGIQEVTWLGRTGVLVWLTTEG